MLISKFIYCEYIVVKGTTLNSPSQVHFTLSPQKCSVYIVEKQPPSSSCFNRITLRIVCRRTHFVKTRRAALTIAFNVNRRRPHVPLLFANQPTQPLLNELHRFTRCETAHNPEEQWPRLSRISILTLQFPSQTPVLYRSYLFLKPQ